MAHRTCDGVGLGNPAKLRGDVPLVEESQLCEAVIDNLLEPVVGHQRHEGRAQLPRDLAGLPGIAAYGVEERHRRRDAAGTQALFAGGKRLAGGEAAGLALEVQLQPVAGGVTRVLGILRTEAGGRFAGRVLLPDDLELGDYRVTIVTLRDATRGGSRSE